MRYNKDQKDLVEKLVDVENKSHVGKTAFNKETHDEFIIDSFGYTTIITYINPPETHFGLLDDDNKEIEGYEIIVYLNDGQKVFQINYDEFKNNYYTPTGDDLSKAINR